MRARLPAEQGRVMVANGRTGFARKAGIALGATVALLAALRLASRLPDNGGESASSPPPEPGTRLADATASAAAAHPGLSGLHLLDAALDAFAARMLLARAAERTLDLQYYIWHGDRTGTLLLEAIHQAAERGVRVRLLLDDNGIAGLDTILAALDRHPNIAVRIFNPFRIRFPKAIGFLADFHRLNRRMHNKSFVADGAVAILGGRNIGDEYFGAQDGGLFADLDVLAIGETVPGVAREFDRYWNSACAYPAAQILRRVSEGQRRKLARRASAVERDPSARDYVERIRELPLIDALLAGTLDVVWARVDVISEPPEKVLGQAPEAALLAGQIEDVIGTPARELCVIAGYFVPGEKGAAMFADFARRGVSVKILTNSYAANDVGIVHAGYAPRRRPLLEAGVRLFEICGTTGGAPTRRQRRRGHRLGIGSRLRGSGSGSVAALRSSASTLHAKTFAVDRERLFIGSFNFDPRSAELNTELGFVIDSPDLAARIAESFDEVVPKMSYEVKLVGDALTWTEQGERNTVVHTSEPNMTLTDRAIVALAERLPIEHLL